MENTYIYPFLYLLHYIYFSICTDCIYQTPKELDNPW